MRRGGRGNNPGLRELKKVACYHTEFVFRPLENFAFATLDMNLFLAHVKAPQLEHLMESLKPVRALKVIYTIHTVLRCIYI